MPESEEDKVDRLAHKQNVMGEPWNDPAHPDHPKHGHFLLRKPVTSPWVNRNLAKEQDVHEIESHK